MFCFNLSNNSHTSLFLQICFTTEGFEGKTKLFKGYIFCFLGHLVGRYIFELSAHETNLMKKRSVMPLYLAPLQLKRAPGIFVHQILSLLENSDGPCIFELFDRETNLGKKYSVSTRVLVGRFAKFPSSLTVTKEMFDHDNSPLQRENKLLDSRTHKSSKRSKRFTTGRNIFQEAFSFL